MDLDQPKDLGWVSRTVMSFNNFNMSHNIHNFQISKMQRFRTGGDSILGAGHDIHDQHCP